MKRVVLLLVVVAGAVGGFVAYRRLQHVPVVVIEVEGKVGDHAFAVRHYYAKDRVRMEAPGVVTIVRLDKNEIWECIEKDRKCTVYSIDAVKAQMARKDRELLEQARTDPAWQSEVAALERFLSGNYEAHESDRTVPRMGYECRVIRARVGNVFRVEELVAESDELPASAAPAALAMAALDGLKGYGTGRYHWMSKEETFGDLVVEAELAVRMPKPARSLVISERLVSVTTDKVKKTMFEIPGGYTIQRWTP